MKTEINQPIWCVIANVVPRRLYGPDGGEIKIGTKHFTPNTKVYVVDAFWGMGGDSVTIIASPRKTMQYVVISLPSSVLHNFRAKLIYKPQVLRLLSQDGYSIANDKTTQEQAKGIALSLSHHRWEDVYLKRLHLHLNGQYNEEFIQQCKHSIYHNFCKTYVALREDGMNEVESATQTIRLLLNETVDETVITALIDDVHTSLGINKPKNGS